MPYRVEEKEKIRIVGIRIPLAVDMDENKRNVPPFWESTLKSNIFEEICALTNKLPNRIIGATVCQNESEMYYYIAGATDQPVPDGMFAYEIPQATWVVFDSNGCFKESVQNIFKRFLTEWLPFSGYTYAELPDIEVYPVTKKSIHSGHFEVWIAVKREEGEMI